jgi:hypothetical protein
LLQQCSSASSWMRTRIFMKEHYTGCQHCTPSVLNGPTQFFSISQYISDVLGPFLHEFPPSALIFCPRKKKMPSDF